MERSGDVKGAIAHVVGDRRLLGGCAFKIELLVYCI